MKKSKITLIIALLIFSIIGCKEEENNPIIPKEDPIITSISNNYLQPFDTLVINGSHFGASQGTSVVLFEDLPALIYLNWTDAQISLLVPEITESGDLKVIVDNAESNSIAYTLNDIPVLLSAGAGKAMVGDTVELLGDLFGSEKGIVEFNGTSAEILSWTNTKIIVIVPKGALSGNLIVKKGSKSSNALYFTIVEPEPPKYPVITSINPNEAYIGDEITILGNNFGEQQGANAVIFGDISADAYSYWSNTSIKVDMPEGAKSGKLKVKIGDFESNLVDYTVLIPVPPPSITSLGKTTFKVGESISINGSNFGSSKGNSEVTFNDISATNYNKWTDSEIMVTVPSGTSSGKIKVTVGGKVSNSMDYTIETVPSPIINSLSHSQSPVGETIQINGQYFGSSAGLTSYVMFGSYKATTTQWSPTSIMATIPEMPAGPIMIYVYANGLRSNGYNFTVMQKSTIIVEMAEIPAGSFWMGHDDPLKEDAYPKHKVTFSKPLLVSKTEISQAQYKKVMNQLNPSRIKDDKNPVEQLTFYAALDFCNRLSKLEGYKECYTIDGTTVTWNKSANGYRLLTEAEWEYACRAGSTGNLGLSGGVMPEVNSICWSADNTNEMKNVGLLSANDYGLFDMHGNAAEWVWDFYDYYEEDEVVDPTGPASGIERVFRGGSYIDAPERAYNYVRSAINGLQTQYYIGFRICRAK